MKNWPIIALRDISDISAGITLGRKTNSAELVDVPYLRVANVQDGRLLLTNIKTVAATPAEITKWRLREGDLLLTEGGDLDKLGRGACWCGQLPVCIHQNHIFRVRLPHDSYDPDFVSLQVGSSYGKRYFLAHAKKTTGIASINQQVLGSFPLLSPPLSEQRTIAACLKAQLAEIETARAAAQAQAKDIALLRSRVLNEVFSSLGDAPLKVLSEVCDIASGITLGRKAKDADLIEVPYLRVANVQDGFLLLDDIKTIEATRQEIEKWALEDGDLLLTEGGDLDKLGRGACWRTQVPLCIHQNHIFRVRLPKNCYNPNFVSFQMGSPYGKAYFLAHAKKTTGIASINRRVLGAFPLISPPIEEQNRIVSRLKAQLAEVEALDTSNKAMLADLEALPQHLLASVFEAQEAYL